MNLSLEEVYAPVSTDELRAMSERAWREASRCWNEYRVAPRRTDDERAAQRMLLDSAVSANDYWSKLRDEIERRERQEEDDARRSH